MDENMKIIENVKATMAIEECFLKEEDVKLLNDFLDNKLLEDEATSIIKSQFIK